MHLSMFEQVNFAGTINDKVQFSIQISILDLWVHCSSLTPRFFLAYMVDY